MSQENDDRRYYEIATFRRECPPPPPPGSTSPFNTLNEWLSYICDNNEPPQKSISYYLFVISEPPEVSIFFAGYNVYGGNDHRIDFKPTGHMFFVLPKNNYDTSTPQIKQRVLLELKEFLKSDKFLLSFLSKAPSIKTNYGDEIWP